MLISLALQEYRYHCIFHGTFKCVIKRAMCTILRGAACSSFRGLVCIIEFYYCPVYAPQEEC